MKIIGLDLSTKCSGYSVFSDTTLLSHGVINLSNSNMDERTKQMMTDVCDIIKKEKPDYVIVEDSYSNGNVQVTKSLAYIIGAVIYQCQSCNIPVDKVLPSTWRRRVGINQSKKKRNELKKEAIEMVKQKYSFDPIEDEAEAILIGLSKSYLNEDDLFG